MIIIALIIAVFLFYGIKEKFVYSNKQWGPYKEENHHVVKKKRDLLIREALHKTYKWREYFNEFLKLLQSPKSLSVENARELVAFLYGSNFLKTGGDTSDDNTEINSDLRKIIGLTEKGMIEEGFTEKTLSDDNKNKLIGYILNEIYGDGSLTNDLIPNKKGQDYFKDLRTNLPKQVIIDRLRYFIEGPKQSNGSPLELPLFDTVFSALGGRTVYTTELSEFNQPMMGGYSGSESPAPRPPLPPGEPGSGSRQRRYRRRTLSRGTSVPPGRGYSSDSLAELRVEQISPGVKGISDETQREPQPTITVTPPSNIGEGIGDVDAQSRPLGPVRPIEQVIVDNDGDPDILKPPKVPHFWGYGVTQTSLYRGDPLRKPLLKALDIIKTWIPVKYEFYDAGIDNEYIECQGGGLGSRVDLGKYESGTIISSRGAGFLNPDRDPKKITLNNLVNNNFDSGRIIVDGAMFDSELQKLKYIKLNKVIEFLKNIIIDLKNNHKDKKVKKEELTQFIITLMKKKNEISKGDKSYLLYLIKKQLNPDIVNAFPIISGFNSEETIPDNTILSIIKDTVGEMPKLPLTSADEEDNTEFTNYHMTNYFKNMLDKVRTTYVEFTEEHSGYENYPPWLKNNSLIKMKTHRDVAENIRTTSISRQPTIDNMFAIGEIMGDNKAGGRPQDKDKKAYLLEKLKLYNVPITNTQNIPTSLGTGLYEGGASVGASQITIPNTGNWLPRNADGLPETYNLTYDQVKEDINIDSLNKDPGEVSGRDKEKYSSTNYNYSKEITDFMLQNDYYGEFLKFTVYFGNINIFVILLTILSYLSNYKNKVVNITTVTNYDKNIFNDQINKHSKYISAFLIVFVIISIFSLKSIKKYGLLFISIIRKIVGRRGDENRYTMFLPIIGIFMILFSLTSFITKPSKQKDRITNLFVSDLSRSKKIQEGDPIPEQIHEKSGEYICYNNTCTNNQLSKTAKESEIKKYGREPVDIKYFENLKQCRTSGCETIGNSGIQAANYSIAKS
jgi:hypothetical protein